MRQRELIPGSWRARIVALAVLGGIAAGTVAFTFAYGDGASYMTNDPEACANCHIMTEQYTAWLRGSHRSVATCNDCHTPKPLLGKYVTKVQNGFWHSFAFTTGQFAEPIRIKDSNRAVTETRCRTCHSPVVDALAAGGPEPLSCLRCHADVGHSS